MSAISNTLEAIVPPTIEPGEQPEQRPLPPLYYQSKSKSFWRQDAGGRWMEVSQLMAAKWLVQQGHAGAGSRSGGLSDADDLLLRIQDRNLDYVGPVAGYDAGYREMNGSRVLVTHSPTRIEPVPGDFPTIRAIMEGLFDETQRPYIYGWMKQAMQMFHGGRFMPGQVLVLAGPVRSGKTLFLGMLTQMFGGRSESPFQAFTKGTAFNGDLFRAEHLVIDDECEAKDYAQRRELGSHLKQVAVARQHRCHAKHRDAITLEPRWRVSIAVNDTAERLRVLPPLDGDIEDKLMLLKVGRMEMPMPTTSSEEQEAFRRRISSELPAFLHFILNYDIPEVFRESRFGIKAYHHPELVAMLHETKPETVLLELIDGARIFAGAESWEGTATQLTSRLHGNESVGSVAKNLLKSPQACGSYLKRLEENDNSRVSSRMLDGITRYTIQAAERSVIRTTMALGRRPESNLTNN